MGQTVKSHEHLTDYVELAASLTRRLHSLLSILQKPRILEARRRDIKLRSVEISIFEAICPTEYSAAVDEAACARGTCMNTTVEILYGHLHKTWVTFAWTSSVDVSLQDRGLSSGAVEEWRLFKSLPVVDDLELGYHWEPLGRLDFADEPMAKVLEATRRLEVVDEPRAGLQGAVRNVSLTS
ncbi:hypothetical protein WN48_02943 [Eufriesea mexicana]|nr:hypothetical protein WN48_02943 [Eufriesea mexicana]